MKENILNKEQREKADYILSNKYAKLSTLDYSELKDLGIVWSFYSGKIEGNTYTYLETENLLQDNITAEKDYGDAKMLKNLYNTFISELRYIQKKQEPRKITKESICSIHRKISEGLIGYEYLGIIRNEGLKISGTDYIPQKSRIELMSKLRDVLYVKNNLSNPIEKAIYLHCNLAKLQLFYDGNKRTARMIESTILINNNIIPIYSHKQKNMIRYKDALLNFYETNSYAKYVDYFLDRQIQRIKIIDPKINLDNSIDNRFTM